MQGASTAWTAILKVQPTQKPEDLERKYKKLATEVQQIKLQANSLAKATQSWGNKFKSSLALHLFQEELCPLRPAKIQPLWWNQWHIYHFQ